MGVWDRTGSRPRRPTTTIVGPSAGRQLPLRRYPYAIAVREYVDGNVVEHRFVEIAFSVAAMVRTCWRSDDRARSAWRWRWPESDPSHQAQLLPTSSRPSRDRSCSPERAAPTDRPGPWWT